MEKKNTIFHLALSNKGRKLKIPTDKPILFLAGPIRNAPKWQEQSIEILLRKNPNIFVAAPLRDISDHLKSFMEMDRDEYEIFERQRAWEQYYLYGAAKNGCIIFWLPKEMPLKEYSDKVYAHITMLELGEWIERVKQNPTIHLVIGTDGEFPEWRTIEFELKAEIPQTIICHSLEETINTAIDLIN